jgi:hypothetical protein
VTNQQNQTSRTEGDANRLLEQQSAPPDAWMQPAVDRSDEQPVTLGETLLVFAVTCMGLVLLVAILTALLRRFVL